MSPTYFDRNHHLQIVGDVNFISTGGLFKDDASFLQITQQAQVASEQSRTVERGSTILCANTAPSALYGYGHSFTGPQCHPGTRVAIQDCIFKWLDDPNGKIAMWMNGPVGIGKSAVAQKVAHLAADRGQLSSAFFFHRSDSTRNDSKNLVATLAYEMTQQMPLTLNGVCRTIAANPLIFSSSLDRQIDDTLLQPLRTQFQSSAEVYRLIIIDGLDECLGTPTQQAIVRSFIFSFLSVSRSTPIIPHKLLLVSRPEAHIESALSASSIRAHVKHFSLDSWGTWDDIGKFLVDKLQEIKDTHPMKHHLPDIWPDKDSLRKLRQRSVGSFAYASAVIRFLALHGHVPEHALQDILSLQPRRQVTAAFAELDTLYRHILSNLDPDIYSTLQKILCLYLYSAQSSVTSLAAGLSEERFVVEIALIQVSSLIHFDGRIIRLHHSSFGEFLRDQERSGEYYVFSPGVASAVASRLSNLWLHPVYNKDKYSWFYTMATSVMMTQVDLEMDVYILRTFVATKIPANIFSIVHNGLLEATMAVVWFFKAIQWRSKQDSDSIHGPIYGEAFDIVCIWLRSRLNVLCQGLATLDDILDIILRDISIHKITSQEDPGFHSFCHLARKDYEPTDFLRRLFPDMDYLEICYGIVEKYLALPSRKRKLDASRGCHHGSHDEEQQITLNELYIIVLGLQDARTPKLCQKLEQLVLDGQKALSAVPRDHSTPKHCIFRILYGEVCDIGDNGQLHFKLGHNYGNHKGLYETLWQTLVEETDRYIREVHANLEFPYVSEDVEALYRLQLERPYLTTAMPYLDYENLEEM